ncbi:MAG TPA: isopentenyl-diphosphate Delta-isomerase [Streptosporangiaceae bacterium]|nr:isopentenyl-diphosphate delta-isomerase, type 1 [Actinomycetes bacterium]HXA57611.1 isopentenyl-diphosphate Delta-isomerase [Streptosporangiaceae bacterium]
MNTEEIVLLDASGRAIGTAPKIASHHRETPYHLAFSSYLVDDSGLVLITQRAHHKATFPSVWTNSCCGHPAPGETLRETVTRRVGTELGVTVGDISLVLPTFDYRAVATDGVVEHEWCPVVRALATSPVHPNAEEVAAAEWRTWDECVKLVEHPGSSPWYREQMALLIPLGHPLDWPAADPALLPPALAW